MSSFAAYATAAGCVTAEFEPGRVSLCDAAGRERCSLKLEGRVRPEVRADAGSALLAVAELCDGGVAVRLVVCAAEGAAPWATRAAPVHAKRLLGVCGAHAYVEMQPAPGAAAHDIRRFGLEGEPEPWGAGLRLARALRLLPRAPDEEPRVLAYRPGAYGLYQRSAGGKLVRVARYGADEDGADEAWVDARGNLVAVTALGVRAAAPGRAMRELASPAHISAVYAGAGDWRVVRAGEALVPARFNVAAGVVELYPLQLFGDEAQCAAEGKLRVVAQGGVETLG